MQVWGRSFKDGTGVQRTPAPWRERRGRWRWCGADRGLDSAPGALGRPPLYASISSEVSSCSSAWGWDSLLPTRVGAALALVTRRRTAS